MALMDENTPEIIKSELEVFISQPTQTAIEQNVWKKYYPITTLDRSGPLEFKIVTNENEYLNPSNHFLYTKCRILSENGTALATVGEANAANNDAIVLPINYFHATQFKNAEVQLKGKSVTSSDNLYAYRAYLETLLSYEKEVKNEQLYMGMYEKDTQDFDEHSADLLRDAARANTNIGAFKRFNRTKNSNTFECIGRIHAELFSQPKLLISGTPLTVKLQRHDQAFSLMAHTATERFTISIETAILFVNQVQVSNELRQTHELAILKTNAKYPIRQVKMKYFTKSAGRTDLSELNLLSGIIPRKIVFGLVHSEGFTGNLHRNPFNFQHFNMQNVVLRINNTPVPFDNIEMNFTDGNVAQGYFVLLHGTNRMYHNQNTDITLADFKNGNTLFAFDLTPDMSNSHFNLLREGTVSLEIKLREACDHSITIVVYSEYDNVISIDEQRNVYLD